MYSKFIFNFLSEFFSIAFLNKCLIYSILLEKKEHDLDAKHKLFNHLVHSHIVNKLEFSKNIEFDKI